MSTLRTQPLVAITVLFACCSIGGATGVGYVSGTPQVAGLATGTGGTTFNYVLAAHASGGSRYDGVDVRIARMHPSGTMDVVMHPPSGTAEMRAVSTDPGSDSVFTLHEDAAVTEWSKDLATTTTTAGATFWSGLAATVGSRTIKGWRACDMEALPGGGFVMSGVSWKGESGSPTTYTTVKGFVLVQVPPTPWASGPDHNAMVDADPLLVSTRDPELHCPRVSWDASSDQLTVLRPRHGKAAGLPDGPHVAAFSLDTSLANELHFVTDEVWALGVDAKWPMWADITADGGFVMLARDGYDGLYDDSVYLYETDGTFHDAVFHEATVAVALPKDSTWQASYGAHVWWMGIPGTAPDLGVLALTP